MMSSSLPDKEAFSPFMMSSSLLDKEGENVIDS